MNIVPLAWVGLGLVVLAWVSYLAAIPRERVPRYPVGHVAMLTAGLFIGFYEALLPLRYGQPMRLAPWLPLGLAILLAGLFFFLLVIAVLPPRPLAVRVGEPLLPFALPNQDGRLTGPADWQGKRVLLKFFRGHW